MKKLLFLLLLLTPIVSFSQQLITDTSKEGLMLTIVQDEFRFDFNNTKAATLIYNDDRTFKGLLVELKPAEIPRLEKITKDGFNKQMLIVFNNKVVTATILQTQLTGHVLFSGLSLADAETFLLMLQQAKKAVEAKAQEQDEFKI